MDNFVCVISNSVLIYNFHFTFPIVVCPNTSGFPGIRDWAYLQERDAGLSL